MELQKVQRTTLTMKEAAEYLGISYWLINQLVRRKEIPCSKVGGKFSFRADYLCRLCEDYGKNFGQNEKNIGRVSRVGNVKKGRGNILN